MLNIPEHKVLSALTPGQAVEALRQALKDGFDPAHDFHRQAYEVDGGQLLTMPSRCGAASGIKILTVNEGSPELDVPRIQGNYLLFEKKTLTPCAIIDGSALTSLRTPAVSFAGILDFIQGSSEPLKTVIFGTGPQGEWHEKTLRDVCSERPIELTVMSRSDSGHENWCASGSKQALAKLAEAELIICCTSSPQPLFEAGDIRQDAIVVALGSHTPDARELPGELISQAQVMVEEIETARREAGDLILAHEDEHFDWHDAFTFADVVTGAVKLNRERPIVFKTTGMGWEDLVLADAIYEQVL